MAHYYNEIDPAAAAWLRELIAAGALPAGDVDDRSIADVSATDVRGYTQCHFFAGVGGWPLALRLAGWGDDRPVWTGSCPCQSFSAAGKGAGFADPRHLWPEWYRLIRECRPPVVLGEQVSAAIRYGWWGTVQANLEGAGYACGMGVYGAHSIGAPHRRQRLWFVAESTREQQHGSGDTGRGRRELADGGHAGLHLGHPDSGRCGQNDRQSCECDSTNLSGSPDRCRRTSHTDGMADRPRHGRREECALPGGVCEGDGAQGVAAGYTAGGDVGGVSDTQHAERRPQYERGVDGCDGAHTGRQEAHGEPGEVHELADADIAGRQSITDVSRSRSTRDSAPELRQQSCADSHPWSTLTWLPCRDGKFRPTQPGLFPLVARVSGGVVPSGDPSEAEADASTEARVMRLRGYGNAIVPQVAAEVIRAYMDCARA